MVEDPVDPKTNQLQDGSRLLLIRRITSGLIWGQLGRVLEIGLGLVFSIVVVRSLGPRDYGGYSVVWSIIGVATLAASLGFGEILLRYLPELNLKNENAAASLARRLFSERLLVSTIIALLVWLAAEPISNWTQTPELHSLIVLVGLLIIAQGIWELLSAYFNATLRMRAYTLVRFLGQALSLGVVLTLFQIVPGNIWVPLFAMLAGNMLSSALYWLGASKSRRLSDNKIDLGPIRRFGTTIWFTNIATFGLANQIDILLIAALLTDKNQAGFYNVSALLLGRVYLVLSGWTTILMPAAAEARAYDPQTGLSRSFNAFMKLNLVILLPAFIFVAAWSKPLITALFEDAFAPAAPLLTLYTLFTIASTLVGANICHRLLYIADRQKLLLGLRIAAGVLNIMLNLLLIPRLGAAGAVLGTGISNLAAHVTELALFQRVVSAPYPAGVATKVILASLLASLPRLLLPDAGWASLTASAILFAAIFAFLFLVLRPFSQADYSMIAGSFPRLGPFVRWFSGLRG